MTKVWTYKIITILMLVCYNKLTATQENEEQHNKKDDQREINTKKDERPENVDYKKLDNRHINKKWLEAATEGDNEGLKKLANAVINDDNEKLDVNCTNGNDLNALLLAALNGHNHTIDLLVNEYKLNIHYADKRGDNALTCAAMYGHSNTIGHLIDQYGFNINYKNNNGENALMLARKYRQGLTVMYLENNYYKKEEYESKLEEITNEERDEITRGQETDDDDDQEKPNQTPDPSNDELQEINKSLNAKTALPAGITICFLIAASYIYLKKRYAATIKEQNKPLSQKLIEKATKTFNFQTPTQKFWTYNEEDNSNDPKGTILLLMCIAFLASLLWTISKNSKKKRR